MTKLCMCCGCLVPIAAKTCPHCGEATFAETPAAEAEAGAEITKPETPVSRSVQRRLAVQRRSKE